MAEPKYVPKIIPQCKVVESVGCVYNLEQVKELYAFDSELHVLRNQYTLTRMQLALKDEVIEYQNKQIKLTLENIKLFKDRNQELTNQLIETDRNYQFERAKLRIGDPILWTIIGVVSSAFVGYVVADQVAK